VTGGRCDVAASTKKKRNASKPKRKPSKRALAAKRAKSARKGAETRRSSAVARERKQAAALAKRRETLRRKAEAHARRVEAGKRGARVRRAKERAREALGTFIDAVAERVPLRELTRVKETWHQEKLALEREIADDYERYLDILDDLALETDTDWDIGYGSTENAA
jgi:hypothetical protein